MLYECPRIRVLTPIGEIEYARPWPACPVCKRLIDSEQWNVLVGHCVRRHMLLKPDADPSVTFEFYHASIDAFRIARSALASVRALQ